MSIYIITYHIFNNNNNIYINEVSGLLISMFCVLFLGSPEKQHKQNIVIYTLYTSHTSIINVYSMRNSGGNNM